MDMVCTACYEQSEPRLTGSGGGTIAVGFIFGTIFSAVVGALFIPLGLGLWIAVIVSAVRSSDRQTLCGRCGNKEVVPSGSLRAREIQARTAAVLGPKPPAPTFKCTGCPHIGPAVLVKPDTTVRRGLGIGIAVAGPIAAMVVDAGVHLVVATAAMGVVVAAVPGPPSFLGCGNCRRKLDSAIQAAKS